MNEKEWKKKSFLLTASCLLFSINNARYILSLFFIYFFFFFFFLCFSCRTVVNVHYICGCCWWTGSKLTYLSTSSQTMRMSKQKLFLVWMAGSQFGATKYLLFLLNSISSINMIIIVGWINTQKKEEKLVTVLSLCFQLAKIKINFKLMFAYVYDPFYPSFGWYDALKWRLRKKYFYQLSHHMCVLLLSFTLVRNTHEKHDNQTNAKFTQSCKIKNEINLVWSIIIGL